MSFSSQFFLLTQVLVDLQQQQELLVLVYLEWMVLVDLVKIPQDLVGLVMVEGVLHVMASVKMVLTHHCFRDKSTSFLSFLFISKGRMDLNLTKAMCSWKIYLRKNINFDTIVVLLRL